MKKKERFEELRGEIKELFFFNDYLLHYFLFMTLWEL